MYDFGLDLLVLLAAALSFWGIELLGALILFSSLVFYGV